MLQIGKINRLKITRETPQGLYLSDEDEEVLLPQRYVPDDAVIGAPLEVFVYFDSEDRLVATTERPAALVGQFAQLQVNSLTPVGAFLDWGLKKDLFLPFAEQTRHLRVGEQVLVYIYLDNTDRVAASMRLEKRLEGTPDYKEGQEVDLLIAARTDLGFKAIINNQHIGVLYSNEIFSPLKVGQRIRGYFKKLRPDGKIDLILQKSDRKEKEDTSEKILHLLKTKNGFLALTEKTPPEKIYELFGVSKKKYKIAVGGLYKKRLITIDSDGLRLVKAP